MRATSIVILNSLQVIAENFADEVIHPARKIQSAIIDELQNISGKGTMKITTQEELRNISQSMTIAILDSLGYKRNSE